MNKNRWLIAATFLCAYVGTLGLVACGNGFDTLKLEMVDGIPTLLPKSNVTCTGKGENVFVCLAKFYPPGIDPNLTKCTARAYIATCATSRQAAMADIALVGKQIVQQQQPAGSFGNGVVLNCGDTGASSWTVPDEMKSNRAPQPHPEGEDAGISVGVDGGAGDSYPEGIDPPGDTACEEEGGDTVEDLGDGTSPAVCSAGTATSTCEGCALKSCCEQKTACDADVGGLPKIGTCGCETTCETAGFSLQQCSADPDPSAPASCGPEDSVTTAYEACLQVSCAAQCGPNGAMPIGATWSYLAAAAAK